MSSSLRVNTIVPSTGTNVAIGTANGTVTFTDSVNFVLGTGSSIFSPSSNTLTFGTNDAERLRITSDGNIGVGNNNPGDFRAGAENLVVGSGSGPEGMTIYSATNASGRVCFADGTGASDEERGMILYAHDDNHMQFNTNAAERLRITSAGLVGIGTDVPSGKLNIAGSDSQLLNLIQDSGDLQIRLNDRGVGSAYIKVPDNTSASLTFETGGSERLRITSAGNVGIGQNNPDTLLHLTKTNADPYNTPVTILKLHNGGGNQGSTSRLEFKTGAATCYIENKINGANSGSGADLVFATPSSGTVGTERMIIGSDGKFYYATTSQGPHGGFFNIDASSGGRNGINVKGTTANYVMISSAGGSTGDHIYFSNYSNGNQETGRIKDNSSNVTYYTSSDYRLKDNIVSITDSITRVKQLNPVRHTWINNPELGTVDGWIAHELDEVCPDAVDGEKDAVREDGSIKAQAADYGRITPLLAAALKEAIAKIEALETRVATLEG